MKRFLFFVILLLLTANYASSDDIFEPEWRDDPRSYHAEWHSWTGILDDPSVAPDFWRWGPGYDPYPSSPFFYWYWDPDYFEFLNNYRGRQNVIHTYDSTPGYMFLPNFSGGDYKKVRLQITYYNVEGWGPGFFEFKAAEGDSFSPVTHEVFESFDHGDGWHTAAYDFEIHPNPDYEWITFGYDENLVYPGGSPAVITQIVVDTICVPEPATMGLLGIGAIAMLIRSKK
jgi:hypothetical protein